MPVINFEYTDNLLIDAQVKSFLAEVHHVLVDIIKTDLLTCRSTITRHQNYVLADTASDHAFIQLSIRMLPGRDKATKDKLGEKLLAMIHETFAAQIKAHQTQIRVYLTEVEREYYYGM